MTVALPHRNVFGAWLSWMVSLAAATVVAVAILVFLGWMFDIELLKSLLHPGRVAMNPASALSFLLLGACLWIQRDASTLSPRAAWLARGMAGIVVLIALCRLINYQLASNLGIDQILFRSRIGGNVMAPNTALTFLLVGTALLIFDLSIGRAQFHPAQVLVISAGCIALFSLTGYFYSALSLYSVGGYIPMALNTSIAFSLLSAGALCARPQRQPLRIAISPTLGGIVARRLIPAAFFVPLLLGWLRLRGQRLGLFSDETGLALFVLASIIVFNILIWWCAQVLRLADLRHQRAEEELHISEERHRAVMQQSADGIYLVDLQSKRILDCNPALERLLGYAPGELTGRTIHELINDVPENIEQRFQRLIEASGALHGEREYRRKDGSLIEVESSASVISYSGGKVACTVVHDITARNRAQRQLQEQHRMLQDALEQLKVTQSQLVQSEKLASLGQMVAGVAHEINNPLAFVSNNVAVLERDTAAITQLLKLYSESDSLLAEHRAELAGQIKELADRIDLTYTLANLKELTSRSRDGLRRIQQIVKDLRDFARLDQAEVHESDLNAGIESTLNIVTGLARKKSVTINKQLGQIPLITCHPAKINQVVMNLISNAIDACKDGGAVTVRSSATDQAVRIEVSDNGQGIDPAIRKRIFDPFFTTKPPGAGTGLGLSISYGIIQDHGGQIDVDSTPGQGSTFIVRLPFKK